MAESKPWLEMELARQFRPVMAPEGLWDRIQSPPEPKPVTTQFPVWLALAAVVLLTSVLVFWQSSGDLRDMTQLTGRDLRVLADSAQGVSLQSDDPRAIVKWLKNKGNIELDLPSGEPGRVHLLGAKLVELRGTLIAAVAYHIGNDDSATLLVSRKKRSAFWNAGATSKHLFTRVATERGTNVFSWSTRDQNFAVAWAGLSEPQSACLLCHADLHGRM